MSAVLQRVEVAVCTYRRPALVDTLYSLLDQKLPAGWQFSVLVIDNDISPSAEATVRKIAETAPVVVRYAHCPASNISIARNGALDHSQARFLAFIDDDEIATSGWLLALIEAHIQTDADAVLGPVEAIYGPDTPNWMRTVDTHSTSPVYVRGRIETGYSCNVLIDRECAAFDGLRFDLSLGSSGGEDTAFFTHAFRKGATFAGTRSALVTEIVPSQRASFLWLALRRYRAGQTHGLLAAEPSSNRNWLISIGLAGLKFAYCLFAAILLLPVAAHRNAALLRGCLHLGTIGGLFGSRPITLYGSSKMDVRS